MILSKLIATLDVIASADIKVEVNGLTCDSRAVKSGFVFAAFKGEAVDGMRFAEQAAAQGAVALLCDKDAHVPIEIEKNLVVLRSANPRLVFAKMMAAFSPQQPVHMVAVTGTNGKTSVAHFCRQIWALIGKKSASIGTIGAEDSTGKRYDVAGLTTPDAVGLHHVLSMMQKEGVEYVAMEASSHGLSQYRQDGVRLQAAGFTSFSRDHLDYHKTEAEYLDAKMRLFRELLPENSVAVLNADIAEYKKLKEIAALRNQPILSYGRKAKDFRIIKLSEMAGKQQVQFSYKEKKYSFSTDLIGEFQAYNLLCALGLVVASGLDAEQAIAVLGQVQAVNGRMECVAEHRGARIYVDYAHTPDGLDKALEELRHYTKGHLIVLFGCGGDRDKGKRSQMGEIACKIADKILVTDDNPRTENAAAIRRDIMVACNEKAVEVENRQDAIMQAVAMLKEGDILLVAGKGHEDYQIIGTEKIPFDEKNMIQGAIKRGMA